MHVLVSLAYRRLYASKTSRCALNSEQVLMSVHCESIFSNAANHTLFRHAFY